MEEGSSKDQWTQGPQSEPGGVSGCGPSSLEQAGMVGAGNSGSLWPLMTTGSA